MVYIKSYTYVCHIPRVFACICAFALLSSCSSTKPLNKTNHAKITEHAQNELHKQTLFGTLNGNFKKNSNNIKNVNSDFNNNGQIVPTTSRVDGGIKLKNTPALPFNESVSHFTKSAKNKKSQTLTGLISNKKSAEKNKTFIPVGTKNINDEPNDKIAINYTNGNALSLASVIGIVLETNPEILIALAQEKDAKMGIYIERANIKPEVDLNVNVGKQNTYNLDLVNENADSGEINISAQQTIYDFGVRKNAVDRRKYLLESANLRLKDKIEEITLLVVEAYIEYLRSSELLTAASINVNAHERTLRSISLNHEAGNATVADIKRAETRLESAKSDLINFSNNQKDSIAAFRRLTGISPEKINNSLAVEADYEKFNQEDIENAISKNPMLLSRMADIYSLKKQWQQKSGETKPEFFVRGESNYNLNDSVETGYNSEFKGMIGFRMKLFDGGRNRYTLEQIEARVDEANSLHDKTYRELRQQFEQNNQALSTSKEKTTFLKQQLAASIQAMDLYRQQFEAGERTPFELLDAQRDAYNARAELINHQYEAKASVYRNMRLNGSITSALALSSSL